MNMQHSISTKDAAELVESRFTVPGMRCAGCIAKVERGQRQYALFAGLNKEGSACGHVSENGASSFLNRYALHKSNSADQSPKVPADSPAAVLDASVRRDSQRATGWQQFDNAPGAGGAGRMAGPSRCGG